jgi:hypothetical protein
MELLPKKTTQPEVKKSDSAYLLDVLSFFHCLGPGFCKVVSGILAGKTLHSRLSEDICSKKITANIGKL